MLQLLLMRHAKSDWSDDDAPDHDRPLNQRGRRDAPRMGRWLAEQELQPTFILSSSARRAQQTVERLVEELSHDVYVEVRPELYLADVPTWLEVLAELPADAACVLCVGHNPGLEALVEHLTGRAERMPTAAVACLTLPEQGWSQLGTGTSPAQLTGVQRPKELPEGR